MNQMHRWKSTKKKKKKNTKRSRTEKKRRKKELKSTQTEQTAKYFQSIFICRNLLLKSNWTGDSLLRLEYIYTKNVSLFCSICTNTWLIDVYALHDHWTLTNGGRAKPNIWLCATVQRSKSWFTCAPCLVSVCMSETIRRWNRWIKHSQRLSVQAKWRLSVSASPLIRVFLLISSNEGGRGERFLRKEHSKRQFRRRPRERAMWIQRRAQWKR